MTPTPTHHSDDSQPITVRRLLPTSPHDVRLTADFETASIEEAYGAVERRTEEQQRTSMSSTPYWDVRHYGAFLPAADGPEVMAGILQLQVPLNENLDMVHFTLETLQAHRGRGVARRLVEQLELDRQELGRPRLTVYGTVADVEQDVDDPDLPINRIAHRLGLTRRNVAVARYLDLPVPDGVLAAMEAEASPRLGDYQILVWHGFPPQEHWLRYGALLTQLDFDEPDEDVELEPQHYDEERIRVAFERRAASGIVPIIAVAVAPDGSLVAHSELEYRDNPGTTLVWQENTLVMPGHRGHRLGLALKAATHRKLNEVAPQMRRCLTWNSHVNDHMIGINEKMGYRVLLREVAFQN